MNISSWDWTDWVWFVLGALVIVCFLYAGIRMLIERFREDGVPGLFWGVVAIVLVGIALLGAGPLGYYE